MAGVCEVLRKSGRILLVMNWNAATKFSFHGKYIKIVVHNRYNAGTEDEDAEGGSVGVRGAPVEHTDERLLVEVGLLLVAEQRRAAQHGGRDPREHHPTLTSSSGLHLGNPIKHYSCNQNGSVLHLLCLFIRLEI